jgi:hypothetical protein
MNNMTESLTKKEQLLLRDAFCDLVRKRRRPCSECGLSYNQADVIDVCKSCGTEDILLQDKLIRHGVAYHARKFGMSDIPTLMKYARKAFGVKVR